jgi:hypothetical protein
MGTAAPRPSYVNHRAGFTADQVRPGFADLQASSQHDSYNAATHDVLVDK